MLANAAKPTFSSRPDENLAAPDVYKLRNSSVVINERSGGSQTTTMSDSTKSLLGSSVAPITASELGNIKYPTAASVLGGLPKVNIPGIPSLSSLPVAATSKATGILGNSTVSNLKNMTGTIAGTLAKTLTAVTPMIVQAGGVSKLIDNVKSGNASTIANAINSMTKAPALPISFKDPTAIVNSVVGVVSASSKLGIPNTLPNVLSGVATGKKDMMGIAGGLLPVVAKTTDLPMLNTLATNNPQGALLGMAPSILNTVSSKFKAPDIGTVSRVGAIQPPVLPVATLSGITSTFAATDPNWNFATREASSGKIANVSTVSSGNDYFKNAVTLGATASNNSQDKDMLYGTLFPSTNNDSAAVAKLQQSNPVAVIGKNDDW